MLKKLKNKSIRKSLLSGILLLALAAALLWSTDFGVLTLLKGPEKAESLSVQEMDGRYVEAEFNFIWEAFAYIGDSEEEAEEMLYMVALEPLADMNDFETARYIGIAVRGSAIQEAAALYARGSIAWETWDAAYLGSTMKVRGVAESLSGSELQFFNELLEESGMTGYDVTPLLLRDGTVPGGETSFSLWLLTLLAAVLAVSALVSMAKSFAGTYQKDLRAWCAASVDPQAAEAQLEEFYYGTQPLAGDLRINDRWVMFPEGQYTRLLTPEDVVWVYTSATRHRTNGIPTGTTYALVLADAAGKRHTLPMRREALAKETAEALFPLLPGAVFGYDEQREKLYRSDRAALTAIAEAQHAPAPATPETAEPVPAE